MGNISTQKPVPSKRQGMPKMRQIEPLRESLSWKTTFETFIPETQAQRKKAQKAAQSNSTSF